MDIKKLPFFEGITPEAESYLQDFDRQLAQNNVSMSDVGVLFCKIDLYHRYLTEKDSKDFVKLMKERIKVLSSANKLHPEDYPASLLFLCNGLYNYKRTVKNTPSMSAEEYSLILGKWMQQTPELEITPKPGSIGSGWIYKTSKKYRRDSKAGKKVHRFILNVDVQTDLLNELDKFALKYDCRYKLAEGRGIAYDRPDSIVIYTANTRLNEQVKELSAVIKPYVRKNGDELLDGKQITKGLFVADEVERDKVEELINKMNEVYPRLAQHMATEIGNKKGNHPLSLGEFVLYRQLYDNITLMKKEEAPVKENSLLRDEDKALLDWLKKSYYIMAVSNDLKSPKDAALAQRIYNKTFKKKLNSSTIASMEDVMTDLLVRYEGSKAAMEFDDYLKKNMPKGYDKLTITDLTAYLKRSKKQLLSFEKDKDKNRQDSSDLVVNMGDELSKQDKTDKKQKNDNASEEKGKEKPKKKLSSPLISNFEKNLHDRKLDVEKSDEDTTSFKVSDPHKKSNSDEATYEFVSEREVNVFGEELNSMIALARAAKESGTSYLQIGKVSEDPEKAKRFQALWAIAGSVAGIEVKGVPSLEELKDVHPQIQTLIDKENLRKEMFEAGKKGKDLNDDTTKAEYIDKMKKSLQNRIDVDRIDAYQPEEQKLEKRLEKRVLTGGDKVRSEANKEAIAEALKDRKQR